MRIGDFDFYRELLIGKSGLVLTPDKCYLLDSRLTPVAKKWGYPSLDAMTIALRGVADRKLVTDVVEAMTTNETSFFRDKRPFELFEKHVLPYLAKTRASKRSIRIWCAASSSGQEPYSLGMILKENDRMFPGWRFDIHATDISNEILDHARAGLYTQFEVQRGLPIQLLLKYFTQQGEKWQLSDAVRKMVRFENFNLLESLKPLGQFDVVFCRNVLIYFDEKTKRKVLEGITEILAPDGFLFLGGAETVLGITDRFKPMPNQRGLYVLSGSGHSLDTPGTSGQSSPLAQTRVSP
ncbi:MAG: chemotaxis protein CheR [Alphaproteobacteria bacterium]|nr:chemotaxis protein CheR [Alphaproteobacteria bacterium]